MPYTTPSARKTGKGLFMEKPTLTGELHQVVGQTGIAILRAQARGYEEIVDILFRHGLMGLNGHTFHEQSDTDTDTDTDLPLSPEGPSFTDAPPAPEVATTPEEPPAAPPVPEEPPAPMPAEDPGPAQRRRGRPRKVITEEAPSLLPAPKAPSEPVEANEPSEPAATPEPTAAGDDDLPW